jgi:hypothetical protein
VINGERVDRPSKAAIAADIASALGIVSPYVSPGSSVDSTFLDSVHAAIAVGPTAGVDTYRKTEILLDRLGLTYDPYWDTSESAGAGGGTVTTRAFSRIRSAVTGVPRCFILKVTDAPAGTRWETNHDEVYRYDGTVSGRMPLNDAGPGSRILYYATSKSKAHGKHFIATAQVGYIGPGWTGPWEARLQNYSPLPAPVPVTELVLPNWNPQHAITEITYDTYQAVVAAGAGAAPSGTPASLSEPHADEPVDVGGADAAERVLTDFPVDGVQVSINVPDALPEGLLGSGYSHVPQYTEAEDGRVTAMEPHVLPPRPRDARRNKAAEVRAVQLATKALEEQGWVLERDCQKDGVGYDLRFAKGTRRLKVEVKGIQGSRLAFNLTPKEVWRAERDPEWVLVAVTSVLSPAAPKVHLLSRDRVVTARRVVTGFRVTLWDPPA